MASLLELNNLLEIKYQALLRSNDLERIILQKEINALEEQAAQIIAETTRKSVDLINCQIDNAVSMAEKLLNNKKG